MKSSIFKIFFILIFSFTFPNTFAQEKPEAILIDKFGLLNCEDIWARQDAFFVEIQNSPTSIAYAVIYGKRNATPQNLAREKLIAGFVEFRKFDQERLKIVRGKEGEDPHTEFWLVPAGADKPDFERGEMGFNFFKRSKTVYLFIRQNEDDDVCPSGRQSENLFRILNGKSERSRQYRDLCKIKRKFSKTKRNYFRRIKQKIQPLT